jgi:hypothetical protein
MPARAGAVRPRLTSSGVRAAVRGLARILHATPVEQGMAPLEGRPGRSSAGRWRRSRQSCASARQRPSSTSTTGRSSSWRSTRLTTGTPPRWRTRWSATSWSRCRPRTRGQLVMGVAMAVGQMVREAYGELPASAGEPLDVLRELGAALRTATEPEPALQADVTMNALKRAADAPARRRRGGGRHGAGRRRGVRSGPASRGSCSQTRNWPSGPSRNSESGRPTTDVGGGGEVPAELITQRSQVQILPPLQEKPGQGRSPGKPRDRLWHQCPQNIGTRCTRLGGTGLP